MSQEGVEVNRAERRALKHKKSHVGGPSGRPVKGRGRRYVTETAYEVNDKELVTKKEASK